MIDHVSLGSHRFQEAVRFYQECFLPLGYRLERHTPEEAAFGPDGKSVFFLYPVAPGDAVAGARCHVAVSAETREKILEFHRRAVQRGAATLRAPGGRPDISPDYFGTVIRDLDGHTIEVVHWSM